MSPDFLTGLDMLKQMRALTGCCDTQPPVVVYRDRPGQSQPAAAVPDDSLRHKAGAVAAFLESTLRTNSRDITDWCDDVEAAANTLRKALAAAPQAPLQAEPQTVPADPDLLVMAVECGLIRMRQVMDADLQDALRAFAKRLLSAPPATPVA